MKAATILKDEVLAESALVRALRSMAESARKKLWIASPFLGEFAAVRKILGRS